MNNITKENFDSFKLVPKGQTAPEAAPQPIIQTSSGYKPKHIFRHDTLGIVIVIGRDVEYNDAKEVINSLLGIKRVFEDRRIDLDLSDIFTYLVIVSSDDGRRAVSHKQSWNAAYQMQTDRIAIDTRRTINNNQPKTGRYSYTTFALVHEIGHAIHMKYVDPKTKSNYDKVARFFLKQISALSSIIKKIDEEGEENELTNDDIDNIIEAEVNKEKKVNNKFTLKIEDLFPKGLKKLYKERCEQYKEENSLEDSSYNNIKSSIYALESMMPSEYGLKNIKEDFAENFALFVLNPAELDSRSGYFNINRMERLLYGSGARGKRIMKAHKNIFLNKYISLIIENIMLKGRE